jgi:acetyl esterase/lipase
MTPDPAQPLSQHYTDVAAALHATPPTPLDQVRDLVEHWGDVATEPGAVDYIEVDAGGTPSMWIVPHDAAEDRVLLCLHGGGFIGGRSFRDFAVGVVRPPERELFGQPVL